jgi:chromosome segregation ATPase
MNTKIPTLDARVRAQEYTQNMLHARIDEIVHDIDASYKDISKYFVATERDLDTRFGKVDARFNLINTHLDQMEANTADFRHDVRIRLTKIEADVAKVNVRLDKVETRLDKVEARLDKIEARLDKVEARLSKIETDAAEFKQEVNTRLNGIESHLATLDKKFDQMFHLLTTLVTKPEQEK